MRVLRRDKDKLIALEHIAKFILDEDAADKMEKMLENAIIGKQELTQKQTIEIRNRLFTTLLTLTPARPGEVLSMTIDDMLKVKETKNGNNVLFFTYEVDEPVGHEDTRLSHKMYAVYGTKYLFMLPLWHNILVLFATYIQKEKYLGPNESFFVTKSIQATNWVKSFFSEEVAYVDT